MIRTNNSREYIPCLLFVSFHSLDLNLYTQNINDLLTIKSVSYTHLGGIGSGKSTIAKIIETLGYPVYISDRRASILINQNQDIRKALTQRFGNNIYLPEGGLDKQQLASIIFNDKNAIREVRCV